MTGKSEQLSLPFSLEDPHALADRPALPATTHVHVSPKVDVLVDALNRFLAREPRPRRRRKPVRPAQNQGVEEDLAA